jgi:hypothetical protein
MIFIMSTTMFVVDNHDSGGVVEQQLDGQAIGQQLVAWHASASQACAPPAADPTSKPCPAGPVAAGEILPFLPSTFAGHGNFSNGAFQSFSTGTYVVSYYSVGASNGYSKQAYGGVIKFAMDSLSDGTVAYVGLYSVATQALAVAGEEYYAYTSPDTKTTVTVPVSVVPVTVPDSGYSAAPIPDGVPMIVTELAY